MKAAVTFRTLGHLSRATTVMALPNSPTIMKMVMSTAVRVISEGENLPDSELRVSGPVAQRRESQGQQGRVGRVITGTR